MNKLKNLYVCGAVSVFAASVQGAAFVEDWNYTTVGTGVAAVSAWNNDWNTDNLEVIDDTATTTTPDYWIRQADGGFTDGTITRSTAGVDLTGPIIRLETSVWLGGSNTNITFGLGNWAPGGWASGPEAFNIRAKRFEFAVGSQNPEVVDNNFTEYFHQKWWDVRLDIDPTANSGDGAATFYYKDFGTSTWLTSATLSNVNLGLTANPSIDTPAEWTQMYVRLSRTQAGALSDGRLGAISIESVTIPEPASMALLACGGLLLALCRKQSRENL